MPFAHRLAHLVTTYRIDGEVLPVSGAVGVAVAVFRVAGSGHV